MRRLWPWIARGGVSLILITLIVRIVGLGNLAEVFARVRPILLVPVVAALWAGIFVFTVRWNLMLGVCEIPTRFRRLLYLNLWGWLGNMALPATIAGDTIRIGGFYQEKRAALVGGSVLLDRALAISTQALVGVLAAGAFVFAMGGPSEFLLVMGITAVAVLVGLALLVRIALTGWMPRWVPERVRETLLRSSGVMAEGIRALGRRPSLVVLVSSLSLVIHVFLAISFYLLLRILGSSPGFTGVFISVPIVGLISLLPVSVGGLGTREGAFVVIYGTLGVDAESAVVASLLFYLCNIVAAVTGLALFKGWELVGGGARGGAGGKDDTGGTDSTRRGM
jgi:uncharacterized protein (TIRG00374 family)